MTEEEKRVTDIRQSYSKVLDRHGYGFQYRVLKEADDLFSKNKSAWEFLASEFPVDVKGYGTRIDFVLRRNSDPFFLLAECKRANPALSNWCFARVPYVHRKHNSNSEPVVLEFAETKYGGVVQASSKEKYSSVTPCHLGLEVRSTQQGDPGGESGKAIEDASTQVLRGLNGMIDMLAKSKNYMLSDWVGEKVKGAYFLPVIFTTAHLWLSDVDLSTAQIENGKVDLSNSVFAEKDWLMYQYHQSPGIKHSSSPENMPSDLSKLLNTEFIRTIPIVSATGIASFLKWSSDFDLDD